MSARIKVDIAGFKQQLNAVADKMNQATRPAAQSGAQIIYERAKALAPVSDAAHMFNIEGRVYGPYAPGNLRDSIYQVFSKDNSFSDMSTYHISWNADKAPYGYAYEFGESKKGAQSFIRRAVAETRKQVREAINQRFIEEVNGQS